MQARGVGRSLGISPNRPSRSIILEASGHHLAIFGQHVLEFTLLASLTPLQRGFSTRFFLEKEFAPIETTQSKIDVHEAQGLDDELRLHVAKTKHMAKHVAKHVIKAKTKAKTTKTEASSKC